MRSCLRRRLLLKGVGFGMGMGALALTGCGFKLRGDAPLSFRSIALTGFAQRRQRLLASVSRVCGVPSIEDDRAVAP